MAIQWFPGHMHLTRKAIAERIKDIDVVIELLDARLPGTSANPLLAELTAPACPQPDLSLQQLRHMRAQTGQHLVGKPGVVLEPAVVARAGVGQG